MNRLNDFQKANEAAQLNQKAAGEVPVTATGPPKGGNPFFQPFQKSSTMEKGEALSGTRTDTSNIPPVITPEDEQMEMPRFFTQMNEIKDTNKRVETFTEEIGKLHKEALSTVDSEVSADLSSKIEALIAKVTQMSNRTRQTLKEMDQVNKQLNQTCPKGSGNLRMRESNFRQLTNSFMEVMRKYQKTQELYQEKYRAQLQRQFLIVKPRATKAELAELTRDPEAMKIQVFSMSVKDDSKKTLGQMKNRLQDMENIERSVVELQQMFLQMQDLVVSQGAIINHIGYNVDQIEDYTAQAAKSMDVALQSGKAIQKKKRYMVMIVLAILGVLLAFALIMGMINFLPMVMAMSLFKK